MRASDLGKRYGWGIHSDAEGRVALYGMESDEYATLCTGKSLAMKSGTVTVKHAMGTKR